MAEAGASLKPQGNVEYLLIISDKCCADAARVHVFSPWCGDFPRKPCVTAGNPVITNQTKRTQMDTTTTDNNKTMQEEGALLPECLLMNAETLAVIERLAHGYRVALESNRDLLRSRSATLALTTAQADGRYARRARRAEMKVEDLERMIAYQEKEIASLQEKLLIFQKAADNANEH